MLPTRRSSTSSRGFPAAVCRSGPALFRRIVFNVAVSNSDDHARNHAALWDGEHLRLSPAYDLCPGPRSGQTAEQAMAFGRSGIRTSTFHAAISVAAEYGLSTSDARSVVDDVVSAITDPLRRGR
jgi:serine/threonine-protein kinase HipA